MTKRFKLSKSVKKAWIQALESGEYQKGIGALCNEDEEYCCLGVLAEELGTLEVSINSSIGKGYLGKAYMLLRNGSDWDYLPEKVQEKLADINDKSDTFEPVVDYIKKNL